jgi:hypothetical protein
MTVAQRLGQINASVEMSTKAREFCNLARIVALSRGNHADAQQLAQDKLIGPHQEHRRGQSSGLRDAPELGGPTEGGR